jgi:hypothetical protein
MTAPQPYTRPELDEGEVIKAHMYAAKLIRNHGMKAMPALVDMVILENTRLVKEIQEHRAARGLEPLPTVEA